MDKIILKSSDTFIEGIRVVSRPLDTDMGMKPLIPFIISVSAETPNYEDLTLDVYSSNSKSIPYTSELDNNWSGLKAQWWFEDIDGNKFEDTMPIDYETEIVDESGKVRGGVGTVKFYYTDNLPSDCGYPTMLQISLNTFNYYDQQYKGIGKEVPAYYNSELRTIIPFQVYPIKPSFLHFSQNGEVDLYDTKWAGTNIHSFVTINGLPRAKFEDHEKCAIDYPIIFNTPAFESDGDTNILDYTIYPLLATEMSPSANPSAEFLPFKMASGIADGGWTDVNATSWVETSGAVLYGTVDIDYMDSDYECTGTTAMWVSNKNSNLLHKLGMTYIDITNPDLREFYDANVKYINNNVYSTGFNVPYYQSSDYDPVLNANILSNTKELSGYSGIYGIAIDNCDNVWSVDFELDRIYKRDSAGNVIFTVDLQKDGLGILPPPYADSEYTWYGPSSISLNRLGDAYITLYNSPSIVKILSHGVIDFVFEPDDVPSPTPPASVDEAKYYRGVDIEVGIGGDIHVLYSNLEMFSLVHFEHDGTQTGTPLHNTHDSYQLPDITYISEPSEAIYLAAGWNDNNGGINQYIWNGSNYIGRVMASDIQSPTYITTDIDNNVWFSYNNNKIGVVTDPFNTPTLSTFEIPTTISGEDIFGGIACDCSGFINIIDKYSNLIYRQSTKAFVDTGIATPYAIKINPEENYIIVDDDDIGMTEIQIVDGEPIESLQAFGDWTGLMWKKKFSSTVPPDHYGTPTKKGPYLMRSESPSPSPAYMRVIWQDTVASTTTIRWGFDTNYTLGTAVVTASSSNDYISYYEIPTPSTNTKYYYRVDGIGEGSFISQPDNDETKFKFLAYGDTRSYPITQDAVLNSAIKAYHKDPELQTFMLHVGDWINTNSEADWQNEFFPLDQPSLMTFKKNVPVFGVRGNHEGTGTVYNKYYPFEYETTGEFYRSYDNGSLHIIMVDQYTSYAVGSAQHTWLVADLDAATVNPNIKHIIMIIHEPGWTATSSYHTNDVDVQNILHPLCLTYGIKILLGGHNHFYSRCDIDGVQHMTIGGGGAPLRDIYTSQPSYVKSAGTFHHYLEFTVDGDGIGFEVIDTDNHDRVFDRYTTGGLILQDATRVTLEGSSSPFVIKSFSGRYDLRRFNDSWDMKDQIKSYVIPDYQKQFVSLWDDLIGNTVGDADSEYQTFGRQFYEKIANFVLNHSDIDLANVSQVYSIFESLALEYTDYDFDYPADLGHWMNILSIVFERLKGIKYPCNRNFKPKRYETIEDCEVCGNIHPSNMGDEIIDPVMVTGEPVVIRDTYMMRNAFDIFYPPTDGSYEQLSDHYGYRSPFSTNYEVFEYIPTISDNVQSEGFINWIDAHSTLAISGISNSEWWGHNGYVEEIFTQTLYGGLGFDIEFLTDTQAQETYSFNMVGKDLTADNTTIVPAGEMVSEYIIPVKATECSPISSFGLPFYTTTSSISGDEIPFGYSTAGITDGLIVSDLYVKIIIGDIIYYAPAYTIEPLILPVVGSGITFNDGLVIPDHPVTSSGFLVFNNGGTTLLLPVYK